MQTDQSKDIVECIDDYLQKIKGYENKREIPTVSGKSSLFVWWKEGNSTISSRSTSSTCSRGEEYTPSPMNIEKVKLQALGKGCENNWQAYAQAFINAVKEEYGAIADKRVVLIIDEINRGNVSKSLANLLLCWKPIREVKVLIRLRLCCHIQRQSLRCLQIYTLSVR